MLVEELRASALPRSLREHRSQLLSLGRVYKQILGADGSFAEATLAASTKALKSGSTANDATYNRIENALIALDAKRDTLASAMSAQLLAAAFHGRAINPARARQLVRAGTALLERAAHLAS